VSFSRTLTAIISKKVRLPQKAGIFSDIRQTPFIPLKNIILAFCYTVFLGYKSLLGFDGAGRTRAVRRLFGPRLDDWDMVCSDSTMQRVARWLNAKEARGFLQSSYGLFKEGGQDKVVLAPGGKLRRLAVMDGSFMGGHYVCVMALIGKNMTYPWEIQPCPGRGHELSTAKSMIQSLPDDQFQRPCDLILYDFLAFNAPLITAAREKGLHILIKGRNPEFRDVLKGALATFDSGQPDFFETYSGFDDSRLSAWTLQETSDTFAGFPVRIFRLTEHPAKEQEQEKESWILTTDFTLTPYEIREASYLRWSIENDVFKTLSAQAGTKRFHAKDPHAFLIMLTLFCAALVAFQLTLFILFRWGDEFKTFLGGMKRTLRNLFERLKENLEDNVFA
jgi:hypothetical protein